MQQQQELKLTLNIEDVNLILEGLGGLPYAKVYAAVNNIQQQAQQQMQSQNDNSQSGSDTEVKA